MVELSSLADIDVRTLPENELRALFEDLQKLEQAEKYGLFYSLFPDSGPLRRELYPKHMEFFKAGATFAERLFQAANRVGKTLTGCYELTAHLTGDYPGWWEGRVFNRAIRAWAAGDFNETTRDVIQKKMLGQVEWIGDKKAVDGTGMVPRKYIDMDSITWKAGVPDLIDTVRIHHRLGGRSTLGFKSYQQGRRSFQGTEQDVIWTDEEPPMDVYNEMLMRLMTTRGLGMVTFTPLNGWTDVIEAFQPKEAGIAA